ncbi:MAG: RpoL/Rpb11 RNA polymerase subunit family protein [Nitrososphaerota archaeon]
MELKIVSIRDDFIELEVLNEDPSILDSLAEILEKIEGVEYSGIIIEHPLTNKTILRIRTNKEKICARDALVSAVELLSSIANELVEKVKQF